MSAGLLLLTHSGIGSSILGTALNFIKHSEFDTRLLTVEQDCEPEELEEHAMMLVEELDKGEGVLVLTDLYGSTPSNIASNCLQKHDTRVVAGLSLSMLIKTLNHPEANLAELSEKAIEGGHEGILEISVKN